MPLQNFLKSVWKPVGHNRQGRNWPSRVIVIQPSARSLWSLAFSTVLPWNRGGALGLNFINGLGRSWWEKWAGRAICQSNALYARCKVWVDNERDRGFKRDFNCGASYLHNWKRRQKLDNFRNQPQLCVPVWDDCLHVHPGLNLASLQTQVQTVAWNAVLVYQHLCNCGILDQFQ